MLSGNCTEALSIQANVTISGSSAKLIINGIAPLPFPLPALLKQYFYTKRGERVRVTCSILCNVRMNYPACFGACPANGRMVMNGAFHGREFPTLPSDDGHASDAPLSGAVAHTFRGRVSPVCGRAGTVDRSDPDERLGSRIGGASCGGVPGTAGSGETISQPEPGGGQPVSAAGCQLRTDGPRET